MGWHRAYGLGVGDWRAGLTITAVFLAVMLPAVFLAQRLEEFRDVYPLAGNGAFQLARDGKSVNSLPLFIGYELGYVAYFISWEFLFRGWLVNAVLPTYGRAAAIAIQVPAFAVMHLGKPELEALGSIVAALALGVLAVRSRSFWYGALIHGAVAVWMDVLSVRTSLFT